MALEGFSRELITTGNEIIRGRRELVPRLAPLAQGAYQRIASGAESLRLEYAPNMKRDFELELAQALPRERAQRLTLVGPHREELELSLNDKSAAQFGSEGQKRTLAMAFKMAQADYLTTVHGSPPVVLIDDIMGELDATRRSGFLPLLQQAHAASGQVFMTATEENWPRELGKDLQRWRVNAGALQKKTSNIEHPTPNIQS